MTRKKRSHHRFSCANCEIEIASRPTIHIGVAFCCAGCVAGGPCTCSYDFGSQPEIVTAEWLVRDCLDVTALDEAPMRARELVGSRR